MGKKSKKEVDTAPNTSFTPVTIESKNCSTVVMMLGSEEVEVLMKAAEAISRFAMKSEENKLQLHGLGTIAKLIPLINHEDRHVKRYSTMSYAVMVKNPDIRVSLRKADPSCISSAIQLLNDDDEVCVEFACLFLANMATDFVNKKIIREGGGIEPLIAHANNSNDPDVQKNSLDCLSLLVNDAESRNALKNAGIVPCLMEKMTSEYPAIQMVSMKALAELLKDEQARKQFRELEGLARVMPLLTKKYPDLHEVALNVLSNCLVDPENMDEIRNNGGLHQLLNFCNESYPTDEVKLYAAQAIGRAAKNDRNTRILHEMNVEQCMVNMLGSHVDNEDILIAVLRTIAFLSNNVLAREAFGAVDGIPLMTALIPHESSCVSRAACLALSSNTLQNLHNSQHAVKANAVDLLISAISHGKDMVIVNGSSCLINMSADISIRQEILKNQQLMPTIAKQLGACNPLVQSKIAELLAALVDGADARDQMVQCNVLEPLVALLRSNDATVRRNVCQALIRCVSDPQVSDVLLRIGLAVENTTDNENTAGDTATPTKTNTDFLPCRVDLSRTLDLLQDINNSEGRRMNSSVQAFNKLIEANLSAKYCVVGKLASHDVTGCRFYDPGRIHKNAKFLPLELLGKKEVDCERAVLLVNYKSQEEENETSKTPDIGETRPSSGEAHEPKHSRKAKTCSTKKKNKEALLREEQERLQREKEEQERLEQEQKEALLKESVYQAPLDDKLYQYIQQVVKTVAPLPSHHEQVIALGQFVASCMGGEVERERMLEFGWQLHIAELKVQFKSNIIPIGEIKRGTYFHRALLYKVLADRIGIPCTLVRGSYNLAWNEVMISPSGVTSYPPMKCIVDLMHDPGRLMKNGTSEAQVYQTY